MNERNLSAHALAKRANITHTTLKNIFKRDEMTTRQLRDISDALNIPHDYLLDTDQDDPQSQSTSGHPTPKPILPPNSTVPPSRIVEFLMDQITRLNREKEEISQERNHYRNLYQQLLSEKKL